MSCPNPWCHEFFWRPNFCGCTRSLIATPILIWLLHRKTHAFFFLFSIYKIDLLSFPPFFPLFFLLFFFLFHCFVQIIQAPFCDFPLYFSFFFFFFFFFENAKMPCSTTRCIMLHCKSQKWCNVDNDK